MRRTVLTLSVFAIALSSGLVRARFFDEYLSGIVWQEPAVIDPGSASKAPSDAIVLFDGKSLDAWNGGSSWQIVDGVAISKGNSINTKQSFGDCQLHVEFATPTVIEGEGQGRGNSGVYLMGRYEVQVLDSFKNKTYFDGQCASIYKQSPPMVNASRAPGEWQTLDIVFNAPRFDAQGKLTSPAYVTVLHNGVLVHNHFELQGGTSWSEPPAYVAQPEKEPLQLQFHGNPVRFRNIWLRENIKPAVGKKP